MYEWRAIGEKQRRHQRRAIAAGWTLPFSWTDTVSSTLRELQILPPFTHREPSAGRQRRYLSANASAAVPRMALRWCLCSRPADGSRLCLRRRPVDGSSLMPRPATFPSMPLHKCFYRHPADGSPLIPSLRSYRTLSAVILAAFPSMTVRLSLRRVPTARSPLIPSRPFSRWWYSDVFGALPPHALAVIFAAVHSMDVRWCLRRVPTARSTLIHSRPFGRWPCTDIFAAFSPHALRWYIRSLPVDSRALMSSPRSHSKLSADTFAAF
jgi:hypothetical protein